MQIAITTEYLSDRSKVHDLVLTTDEGDKIRLACIDQDCAIVLADMLCDAINDFTVGTARRVF